MKFVLSTTFSRMRRQKTRLAFVALAIAASSCLIVWTIGGFQALFIDATTEEAGYLGTCDVRIAAKEGDSPGRRGGGAAFGGPLAVTRPAPDTKSEEAAQAKAASRVKNGENDEKPKRNGRGKGGGRGGKTDSIPPELIAKIRSDKGVAFCVEIAPLKAFVYSPGTVRSILEDQDAVDEGDRPTLKRSLEALAVEEDGVVKEAGIDPALRRRAYAAYRAVMGTPSGIGSTFYATDASEPPFELAEGKWFASPNSTAREAVLTEKGAEKTGAKPGDDLFVICQKAGTEFQLKVVGVVADPNSDAFYVSAALGREIAGTQTLATSTLLAKLRTPVDDFRERWGEKISSALPNFEITTEAEIVARKAAQFKQNQSFKYQAASGTLLAALASIFIVFTALNASVANQRRLIAFYRAVGLTRGQVGLSILLEALILAIPGWIGGVATGWALVFVCSGKATGLNWETVGVSFLCAVVGAVLAALYPMAQSARTKPLEALGVSEKALFSPERTRRQTRRFAALAVLGAALIGVDVYLVQFAPGATTERAALHSVVGVSSLALGVVCLIPTLIRVAELVLLPALAKLFRFDFRLIRTELSGNAGRVVAVAVALSVGGGLFVSTQIWGYSMLEPFLPGRGTPNCFAAFLPNGARPEIVSQLRALPCVKSDEFIEVAVEQAAFEEGSIPPQNVRKSAFANVVFFGVDVDRAFRGGDGKAPLLGFRFLQGDPDKAFAAMESGRGVVVTDSLSVDYNLNLGDELRVVHPRDPGKTLSYPIVGVVYYPGWQWLSKTGGVRRNFGRSGGIAFASEKIVAADYRLERPGYFWFNESEDATYNEIETACDALALKSLRLDEADGTLAAKSEKAADVDAGTRTAYVKLSTRDSLTRSISKRADSVIWGLSKTPITTLIIASIAVVGAIANSVRARRRQFGTMRSIGLTRGALIRAILVEAILIATVATATSFIFGFLAAQGALKLGASMFGTANPPLILPIKELAFGFLLTLTLCLTAALWPAIRAGVAEPLELLRSDRAPD